MYTSTKNSNKRKTYVIYRGNIIIITKDSVNCYGCGSEIKTERRFEEFFDLRNTKKEKMIINVPHCTNCGY